MSEQPGGQMPPPAAPADAPAASGAAGPEAPGTAAPEPAATAPAADQPAAPAPPPPPYAGPAYPAQAHPGQPFAPIPRPHRVPWVNPARRLPVALVALGIALACCGGGIGIGWAAGSSGSAPGQIRIQRGPMPGGAFGLPGRRAFGPGQLPRRNQQAPGRPRGAAPGGNPAPSPAPTGAPTG